MYRRVPPSLTWHHKVRLVARYVRDVVCRLVGRLRLRCVALYRRVAALFKTPSVRSYTRAEAEFLRLVRPPQDEHESVPDTDNPITAWPLTPPGAQPAEARPYDTTARVDVQRMWGPATTDTVAPKAGPEPS